MAEVICIIGTKGGTGKTTLSHMICYGLTLLGRRAACVMTDELREPLRPERRGYVMADARSPKAREKVMETMRNLQGWIGVLDGGANRTDTDQALYKLSNLVLLPFRDSAEDLRSVMQDLERYPRAWALPSQWPTNNWQQEASGKLLATVPEVMRSRILAPVHAVSSSKLLLQSQIPETLPTVLNNAARSVADMVLTLMSPNGHREVETLEKVEARQPHVPAAWESLTRH